MSKKLHNERIISIRIELPQGKNNLQKGEKNKEEPGALEIKCQSHRNIKF